MTHARKWVEAIAAGTLVFIVAWGALTSFRRLSSPSSTGGVLCPPCSPLEHKHDESADVPGVAWLNDLDGHRGPPLRIYVYDLGDNLRYWKGYVSRPFCKIRVNSYEMEYEVSTFIERSTVRTHNASEAHLFYIPALPTCVMQACKMRRKSQVCRHLVVDPYMNAVMDRVEQSPWFRRSGGRDHVMTITWDPGRRSFSEKVQNRLRPLIMLQNLGSKKDSGAFVTHHDVVIPQRPRFDIFYERANASLPQSRSYLAYFRGVIYDNHPRAALRALRSSPDMHIVNTKIGTMAQYSASQEEYWTEIRNATFCLCPTGLAPWSSRLFDCIFVGSIPVLMAQDIVLPFEDFVPYREMIISIPEEEMKQAGDILRAISPEVVAQKLDALAHWAGTFMYHDFREVHDVEGDAYHTILKVLARRASVYPAVGRELDIGS